MTYSTSSTLACVPALADPTHLRTLRLAFGPICPYWLCQLRVRVRICVRTGLFYSTSLTLCAHHTGER